MCTRVLIADDQPSARRSLNALLTAIRWSAPSHAAQPSSTGFFPIEVVGVAEDGPQTLEQVQALYPDVVVIDLQLHTGPTSEAKMNGLETIQTIKRRWPAIRIVVLTMYTTDRLSVLAAGADAFLLKGCSTQELLEAVTPRLAGGPS